VFEGWKTRRESKLIAAEHEALDKITADLAAVQDVLASLKDTVTEATRQARETGEEQHAR
jgi:predicted secreted protein